MDELSFEWDAKKEIVNLLKHRVGFVTAQLAFVDPDRVIWEDEQHSRDETRYYCFGKVDRGILTVRFTMRGDKIRIIGAGYWRRGKAIYEKANQIHWRRGKAIYEKANQIHG